MSDTNLHGLNYLIGNSRPVVQHAITEMPRLFEKKISIASTRTCKQIVNRLWDLSKADPPLSSTCVQQCEPKALYPLEPTDGTVVASRPQSVIYNVVGECF